MTNIGYSTCVIPHYNRSGGAGKYIQTMINDLEQQGTVTASGKFAEFYTTTHTAMPAADMTPRLHFPAYSGVHAMASLLGLFQALVFLVPFLGLTLARRASLAKYDVFVFTSSIQIMAVVVFSYVFGAQKVILIVQEDVRRTTIYGRVFFMLAARLQHVVAITPEWACYADATLPITPVVVPNQFDRPGVDMSAQEDVIVYDILYVGGGERIKGLETLLQAAAMIDTDFPVRIALLGRYQQAQVDYMQSLVADLSAKGITLHVKGYVDDAMPFYKQSTVLALPITEPHFCRPAIEAGLCGKSFVITDLPNLTDFAHPDVNCLMFDGHARDLADQLERLLSDDPMRTRLERENSKLSLDFARTAAKGLRLSEIVPHV